jgi:hypothetical protein
VSLFTYAAIENEDETNQRQRHEQKDENLKRQPGTLSTAAERLRVVGLLRHHDHVFAVRDKHIVVDVDGDARQIAKVSFLKLVVHFHQKLHGQRIEKHIQKVRVRKDDPQVGQVHQQIEAEFLKGVEHDNVTRGRNHLFSARSVDNIIPQEKRLDKVKHGDGRHHQFFFAVGPIRTDATVVGAHLV